MAIMVAPFGTVILEGLESATYTVSQDLHDMIEVYDSGTTDDKSDDIVVFANGFWNRFSLSVDWV